MIRINLACLLTSILFLCGCALLDTEPDLVWIDVRSEAEYEEEHLEGALNIEYSEILEGIALAALDKDTEILLYCGSGRRAGIALEALEAAGFSNVVNRGGLDDVLGRAPEPE